MKSYHQILMKIGELEEIGRISEERTQQIRIHHKVSLLRWVLDG